MPCGITRPQWVKLQTNRTLCNDDIGYEGGGYEEKEDWAQKTLIDLTWGIHFSSRRLHCWSIQYRLDFMHMDILATNSTQTTTSHMIIKYAWSVFTHISDYRLHTCFHPFISFPYLFSPVHICHQPFVFDDDSIKASTHLLPASVDWVTAITHWGLNKITVTLQATFSRIFSWMGIFVEYKISYSLFNFMYMDIVAYVYVWSVFTHKSDNRFHICFHPFISVINHLYSVMISFKPPPIYFQRVSIELRQ